MFGLGMWEILLILALALIFIGPKKLPDIARMLGKGLREFRGAAGDFRDAMDITPTPGQERLPEEIPESAEAKSTEEETRQAPGDKPEQNATSSKESAKKQTDGDSPADSVD